MEECGQIHVAGGNSRELMRRGSQNGFHHVEGHACRVTPPDNATIVIRNHEHPTVDRARGDTEHALQTAEARAPDQR
jgi:hypothetical protein